MRYQLSVTAVVKIDGKLRAVRLNVEADSSCELLEATSRAGLPNWDPIESEEERKVVLEALKVRLAKLAEVDLEKALEGPQANARKNSCNG